jgi:hypothetical protein
MESIVGTLYRKISIEIGVSFYRLFPSVTEISWNFPNLGLGIFWEPVSEFYGIPKAIFWIL